MPSLSAHLSEQASLLNEDLAREVRRREEMAREHARRVSELLEANNRMLEQVRDLRHQLEASEEARQDLVGVNHGLRVRLRLRGDET